MAEFTHRFEKSDFGEDFTWGTASSSFQTEGAWDAAGKSPSIWDTFLHYPRVTKQVPDPKICTDFYNRYASDLELLRSMNFSAFRFSLSWPRILPQGTGKVNPRGVDFYNKLIDTCLSREISPWITLYHWDLPQYLEAKGGWTNRDMVNWFKEYAAICAQYFGDRVKNWMVLNEPLSFTALGYLLGKHAPGRRGLRNFVPAIHHAALCQAEGSRVIKRTVPDARVGSTFFCAVVEPHRNTKKDCLAASKLDAALNRLFIEPALGLGYPLSEIPELRRIEDYYAPGDDDLLACDFDFIGLQYYFRVIAAYSRLHPFRLKEMKAAKRHAPLSLMNYEIYPQGLYRMIKKFRTYDKIKRIIITECGVCLPDQPVDATKIMDHGRIRYYIKSLETILNCRREGIPVDGFFAWSLTDNLEWAEGFEPRFGLVFVDYNTQTRIMKESGKWFKEFLSKK
jgi:beta-glucosidase